MKVVIYTQNNCQFTPQEKTYLTSKGVTFEEKNVETNKEALDEMMKLGSNFAGTPVTQITKDDGTTAVLKGFTQTEFDAALGASVQVQTANADVSVSASDQPIVPPMPPMDSTSSPQMPEPVPPAPMDLPSTPPMPEPMPMDSASSPQVPEPPVPPMPEPIMPSTPPSPTASADNAESAPAPVEPPLQTPSGTSVQAANADMNLPASPAGGPTLDQTVVPQVPEPVVPPTPPEPLPEPVAPTPSPEPVMPPAPTQTAPASPSATEGQASNPLDAILADLQRKVSASTPPVQSPSDTSVQAANADMTMPTPPSPPADTTPSMLSAPPSPTATVDTPAPMDSAPSVDSLRQAQGDTGQASSPQATNLPNVPDFDAK